ncbi:ras-related protein Rab-13-like isoform X1 [Drosophila nasuta]|uniref:ras-related protein Rab-13-like isoform X1 n=1 Tax=Drosophila nasuta TaxID=42062 RepID=UPI00295E9D0B|nr:ras-related protein Rab-13-like isoform X1 [Drosophila nasuta]XP_060644711.1 ras-related protein Rab-13-like isoform X1 [Drosophila nasuta]
MGRSSTINKVSRFDVMLLGDSGVGKTSLLMRIMDEKTIELKKTSNTTGPEQMIKTIVLPDAYIRLNICDTPGPERFIHLLRTYYKNCQGALLVYDIQNRKSFERVQDWVFTLREEISSEFVIVLAGNKMDMENNRHVSKEEAIQFATAHNCLFLETSAMSKENVSYTFKALVLALHNQQEERNKVAKNQVYSNEVDPDPEGRQNEQRRYFFHCSIC